MAIIANRTKSSPPTFYLTKILILAIKKGLLVFYIILSLMLLYFSSPRAVSNMLMEISGFLITKNLSGYEFIVSKVSNLTSGLVSAQNLEDENLKLKLEITELKAYKANYEFLEVENLALKKLVNFVDPKSTTVITAQLLSYNDTGLRKTAIVSAGQNDGVVIDQIVENDNGLVGRIIEVSKHYATVLLVSDSTSRIPVILGSSHVRGILVGNGKNANLIYLPDDFQIVNYEKVITSGDGKIFPANINIGRVIQLLSGELKVELNINSSKTSYVKIREIPYK